MAQQVRSNALRFRAEAEEYTNLLWKVVSEEGVTLYRLAKSLGVTHSALRFRLIRYGYIKPSSDVKSKVYQPIAEKNRAANAVKPKQPLISRLPFLKVG
jgi:Zn-dependent peptidase ImmA (M78 family)